MNVLDNEGHDPSGLGNQPVLFNAPVRAQILKLEAEIGRLRAALKPFADAVYNDNGDMSITPVYDREHYIKAYFALRNHEQDVDKDKT